MKRLWIYAGCILGCLLIIPTFVVYLGGYYDPNMINELSLEKTEEKQVQSELDQKIIGVLAKEVPTNYEYEALKAQAVLVRTYMLRRQLGIITQGQLEGLTMQEMKDLWQEDFDEIYQNYEQAVNDTRDEVIYYEKEIIEPIYHRSSGGETRNAKEVYGMDIPYLQPVSSEGDPITQEIEISKIEIATKLRQIYKGIIIDENILEQQIQIIRRDESEYITQIQIGSNMMTGEELKKILGLPSSNFEIQNDEDKLMFKVKGIGHGVGLSQNGANELAKNGSNYTQILSHYFTGTQIKKYSK
ncbi:MAG: SpoIID/LytB domain-containing protein [Cellulosilyticaceae bacterium]